VDADLACQRVHLDAFQEVGAEDFLGPSQSGRCGCALRGVEARRGREQFEPEPLQCQRRRRVGPQLVGEPPRQRVDLRVPGTRDGVQQEAAGRGARGLLVVGLEDEGPCARRPGAVGVLVIDGLREHRAGRAVVDLVGELEDEGPTNITTTPLRWWRCLPITRSGGNHISVTLNGPTSMLRARRLPGVSGTIFSGASAVLAFIASLPGLRTFHQRCRGVTDVQSPLLRCRIAPR
jgi:hypothetical protein